MTIRGPEEYLPKFSKPNCEVSTKEDEKVESRATLFFFFCLLKNYKCYGMIDNDTIIIRKINNIKLTCSF